MGDGDDGEEYEPQYHPGDGRPLHAGKATAADVPSAFANLKLSDDPASATPCTGPGTFPPTQVVDVYVVGTKNPPCTSIPDPKSTHPSPAAADPFFTLTTKEKSTEASIVKGFVEDAVVCMLSRACVAMVASASL